MSDAGTIGKRAFIKAVSFCWIKNNHLVDLSIDNIILFDAVILGSTIMVAFLFCSKPAEVEIVYWYIIISRFSLIHPRVLLLSANEVPI